MTNDNFGFFNRAMGQHGPSNAELARLDATVDAQDALERVIGDVARMQLDGNLKRTLALSAILSAYGCLCRARSEVG